MKPQAVIFDFDGIIVDSEPLHHKAFTRVLDPIDLGIPWARYYEHYLGFDDRDVVRERFREAGRELDEETMAALIRDKADAFLRIIEDEGVSAYPGVVDFVRSVSAVVPCGISSGALLSDIEPIVGILGLGGCFKVIVTADQVAVSKPDPESYQVAFGKLKIRYPDLIDHPTDSLAIEDTPAGIRAAKGAGLTVLAVTNTYSAGELAEADRVVESLDGLDLDELIP